MKKLLVLAVAAALLIPALSRAPAGAEEQRPALKQGYAALRFPYDYWFTPPEGTVSAGFSVKNGIVTGIEVYEWRGEISPGKLLKAVPPVGSELFVKEFVGKKIYFMLFVRASKDDVPPSVSDFYVSDADGNRIRKTRDHDVGWLSIPTGGEKSGLRVRSVAPILEARVDFRKKRTEDNNEFPRAFSRDAPPPTVSMPDLNSVLLQVPFHFAATKEVRFHLKLMDGFPLKGLVSQYPGGSPLNPFDFQVKNIKIPGLVKRVKIVTDAAFPLSYIGFDLWVEKGFSVREDTVATPDGKRKVLIYEIACKITKYSKAAFEAKGFVTVDLRMDADPFAVTSEMAEQPGRYVLAVKFFDEDGNEIMDLVKEGTPPFDKKGPSPEAESPAEKAAAPKAVD